MKPGYTSVALALVVIVVVFMLLWPPLGSQPGAASPSLLNCGGNYSDGKCVPAPIGSQP